MAPPAMAGRWSRLPQPDTDPTRRAVALSDVLLDRYGVVTRGAVVAEGVSGGFSAVYPVLKAAEESGRVRRGYFVEGLGAAQFAVPGAIDRLRSQYRTSQEATTSALVVAATDPANPYGAALPWPDRPASVHADPELPAGDGDTAGPTTTAIPTTTPVRRGHQPARKAGALVVLVDGGCAIYVERGGRTLLSFTDEPAVLQPAADALALAVRDGALGRLSVERADGAAVVASPLGDALEAAGFRPTPRGLRLRG
jgi:ATP-dependent Lhr-like helicase